MTPIQLEYFIEVAKTSNMTRVAENYHVSQPAISKAIRDLEKEFDIVLFDRSKKTLSLTANGYEFYNHALTLLKYNASCHDKMLTIGKRLPDISLGITSTLAPQILPGLYLNLEEKEHSFTLNVQELIIPEMMHMLQNGLVDLICFATSDTSQLSGFYWKEIKPLQIQFCVNPLLAKFNCKTISFKDIADTPLILFERESNQNTFVRNQFNQLGLTPNIVFETKQVQTNLAFIENGIAGGFVDRNYFACNDQVDCYNCREYPASKILLMSYQKNSYFDAIYSCLI